jgi:hypothetical protein
VGRQQWRRCVMYTMWLRSPVSGSFSVLRASYVHSTSIYTTRRRTPKNRKRFSRTNVSRCGIGCWLVFIASKCIWHKDEHLALLCASHDIVPEITQVKLKDLFNVFHVRALYHTKTLITNKCTKRVLSPIVTHSYIFRPC